MVCSYDSDTNSRFFPVSRCLSERVPDIPTDNGGCRGHVPGPEDPTAWQSASGPTHRWVHPSRMGPVCPPAESSREIRRRVVREQEGLGEAGRAYKSGGEIGQGGIRCGEAAGEEVTKERGQAGVTRGRRRGHVFESCLTQEVGPGVKVINRISLENPEEGPPLALSTGKPSTALLMPGWVSRKACCWPAFRGHAPLWVPESSGPPPPCHTHSRASACCVEQGDSHPLFQ